jgi:hypothetical protein
LQFGYWLAFLGARLAAIFFVLWGTFRAGKEGWVLLVLGIGAAVALGNLSGAPSRTSMGWGLLMAAVFCAPIFPVLLGGVLSRFRDEPGTAFGVLAGAGALGSMVLLPLTQSYARRTTVQRGLRIPLVVALLLATAALVLGLTA